MRKIIIVILALVFVSCGQVDVVLISRIDFPWGSIGLAEGWVVSGQSKDQFKLESQMERSTEITIRQVRIPQDIDGYAKSFIEASGRQIARTGTMDIDGRQANAYWMTAVVGADDVSELLVLIPHEGKMLAVDAMWITKSVLADVPEGMVKSLKLGGK